jgi:hypothetical protein
MTMIGQNFSMYQGDTKNIEIEVTDANDAILPLDPYDGIRWVMYHPTTKALVLEKTLGDGITVPTPANGVLVISLEPSDTESVVPNTYNHECELMNGATVVATVTTGIIKIIYSKA